MEAFGSNEASKRKEKQERCAEWVERYSKELYNWAYHKTFDRVAAEDLVQDTFLAAYQAHDSFEGKSHPKTWLFTILKNKLIDHYRGRIITFLSFEAGDERAAYRLTESLFTSEGNWANSSALPYGEEEHHLLDDPEFRRVMEICLGDLPSNWRTALLAKYLLNKNGKEICQQLRISPANYWQILFRAKLMMRKCLERQWFK